MMIKRSDFRKKYCLAMLGGFILSGGLLAYQIFFIYPDMAQLIRGGFIYVLLIFFSLASILLFDVGSVQAQGRYLTLKGMPVRIAIEAMFIGMNIAAAFAIILAIIFIKYAKG